MIQNIEFGAEKNKKKKQSLKINDLIKLLHLEHVREKFPHEISSGEAQSA